MRIVVHPPTVEAPDGTEHVAAIVLAVVHERIRELGAGIESGIESAGEAETSIS